MRKSLLTIAVAAGLVFSSISPANATSSDSLSAELSSESSSSSLSSEDSLLSSTSSESENSDLIVGVVTIAAVGGLIAAGVQWAVQQHLIPNPLPGIIADPPAPAPAPAPQPAPAPAPAPQPAPQWVAPAPAPVQTTTSYRNCTAVWNAIGGPIRRGDAGYASHLDRDSDGVGCESDPR